MNTLFGIVLVLGLMILVHEWGHFIVARFFGVRVDVFSIGFGPRLFGWKRGATDYRISALPLGGYVRMAGQDLSEIDSGEKAPTGASDEVMSKPRWQRALISFAGPAVNLVMPVLLLGGFFWVRGLPYQSYLDKAPTISAISEKDPVAKEGIVPGDRIVEINGIPTPTWEKAEEVYVKASQEPTIELGIEHGGAVRKISVASQEHVKIEAFRWYTPELANVDDVFAGQPAARGGLKVDDSVVSVNGTRITSSAVFVDLIRHSKGAPLDVKVQRNGKALDLKLQPEASSENGEDGQPVYKVGASLGPKPDWSYRKVGFVGAFQNASQATWNGIQELFGVLGKLFTGKLSVKQLQGVVGIAYRAGRAVQAGSFAIVSLMAMISLNLGILNLLPIPILDGGHILLLSIEGLRRRDLSLAFKERFIQVGLVFLLLLFAFVMYNDVRHLLPTHT
ncbi:MAG TPA: RIP metalloprotease RseP [Candidatus Dormibacteraeota bacterium]|jgi:regulator of sigma E protease|nr:RIP metalloprotease RseP [Candidatus Dormibacteraeota bacterium]